MDDWTSNLHPGSVVLSRDLSTVSVKINATRWKTSETRFGTTDIDGSIRNSYGYSEDDLVHTGPDLVSSAVPGTTLLFHGGAVYKWGTDHWKATGEDGTYTDRDVRVLSGLRWP